MRRMVPFFTLVAGVALVGCQDKPTTSTGAIATTTVTNQARKHDNWWCREHGIPEEECLMCKPNAEAELKKKGDWCEKHEYAKSQCFACNPALRERYAAQYRAKYGKEPPEADENPGKPEPEPKQPEKK
ncbi:MAG TPA: hypothetical protein VKD90_03690 [Gemmataceae bacterium]|nr:hypothetical protein [Gemmataceae bacterium]